MDSAIIVAIVALMGTVLTTVLNMRFRNLQEEVEEAHKRYTNFNRQVR